MPPEDDDSEVDEGGDDDDAPANRQTLVRLPPRRHPPPPPAPDVSSHRPVPSTKSTRRRRPAPPAPAPPPSPDPAMTTPAPPPVVTVAPLGTATDGNVLLAFGETIKLFPAAAQTIAVERKTGTPAHWMIGTRPRTANELYDAIKLLHGRNPETTYEITFRDEAGHGNSGQVSIPSTLNEPVLPVAPSQPYAQPYAPPYLPPPAPVFFAPPQPAPPAPPLAAGTPFDAVLAMQKQMFEMVQAMQAGHPPPPPPPQPLPPPPPQPLPQTMAPVQPDPATALLAMQKQLFEMMQAMQATAAGHAQPIVPPTPTVPPQTTDSTAAILAMQKMMFEQMLTMMQTAQRGLAGGGGGGGGPSATAPYYRPRYQPHDPNGAPSYDPRQPQQPVARPQSPSEQLRDAVSVVRSTFEVAREFGFGSAPAESPPPEDDDSPVRVIDMGPAKGVINRGDGSLRGVETFMANLPDILKWVGEQRAEIRKATEEKRRHEQQRLPPGYVMAGPDYQPPEGFVAIPVDQIPPQAASAQPVQQTLPDPPAEMPPPIESPKNTAPWGMPPPRM
jgi:hypothetical protein